MGNVYRIQGVDLLLQHDVNQLRALLCTGRQSLVITEFHLADHGLTTLPETGVSVVRETDSGPRPCKERGMPPDEKRFLPQT